MFSHVCPLLSNNDALDIFFFLSPAAPPWIMRGDRSYRNDPIQSHSHYPSYSKWQPRFQIRQSRPAGTTPNSLQNTSRSISCWEMANLLYLATPQWIMVLNNPMVIRVWFDMDKRDTESSPSFRSHRHSSNRNIRSGVWLLSMWGATWSVIGPWPSWWP